MKGVSTMNEVLKGIDWSQAISTLWTVILLPIITYIGTQAANYAKAKKIDKYTDILYQNVVDAVKDVYQAYVENIKGTADWDNETKESMKELAKTKTIHALTTSIYQALKTANNDFDEYLDSLIETAIYDLKRVNV